jgi:phosphopantothenoylcysteine decarboxylase/phosphopantothenate--cysteine ligase
MRVVLGVGAGIAAYKACEVASRLTQDGHEVFPVLTAAALQFVGALTFEALTHRPVAVQVTDEPVGPLSHVTLAHTADLLLIAPLTADLMARMAGGRADDMLTAVYLGARCPVVAAPAMESEMWEHPAVRRLRATLAEDGVQFVGPASGRLASGLMGAGRLADPADIVEAARRALTPATLAGRRVLITAGPTREFFDPVRCLTNPSTGAMGVALARAAWRRGASVTLVHGPLAVPVPREVTARPVTTALEMEAAVGELADSQDVIIASAAVSDWRPRTFVAQKQKKRDLPPDAWALEPNPDILAGLGRRRRPGQVLVGFAAETDDITAHGREKLAAKRVDLLVANRVGPTEGFGSGPVDGWLLWPDGRQDPLAPDKEQVAAQVLDAVERLLG